MDGLYKTFALMLGLIALYLVVYYSGGAAKVIDAMTNTLVQQTKSLQGR